jgi:DNA-binding transcriptional ArsR family regulator
MINLCEEVGEASRRALLVELLSGPKTVNELCRATALKQANVSNHLARMRRKNIIDRDKRGREAYYRILSPEIMEAVSNLIPEIEERLDTLDLMTLADLYLRAGLRGDEFSCSKIVDRAIGAGLTLVSIDEDLFGTALRTVGGMLTRGECDEAQEHLLCNITERMIARVAMARQSLARIHRVALLSGAPNQHHMLSLRMISDYLKSAGWEPLFLGSAVSASAFRRQIEDHEPDLVVLELGAQGIDQKILELISTVNGLRKAGMGCRVGLTGPDAARLSTDLRTEGVDFISHSLREFAYQILPELDLPVVRSTRHYMQ